MKRRTTTTIAAAGSSADRCTHCGEEFSDDCPQLVEGIVTESMCLCSECGMRILDVQYDSGIPDAAFDVISPMEIMPDGTAPAVALHHG